MPAAAAAAAAAQLVASLKANVSKPWIIFVALLWTPSSFLASFLNLGAQNWTQDSSSAPKLVFNRLNGKRRLLVSQSTSATEESYTVAHEENVRFVYEAWQQVEQQLSDSQQGQSGAGPVQYMDKTPSPELKDFVPIDLEEWWAQQFLATIENGS
ncbi:MAPK regulated corepressor interacting protein 2 [Varanus komodoensis]|nr:MAPK regulated corepressor interacting protein 2 [Varanus komodoensis]